MAHVQEWETKADLEAIIGGRVDDVEPYYYDDRIGWDTHLVVTDGKARGFTDGPIPEEWS
jgi:hypothetical protein